MTRDKLPTSLPPDKDISETTPADRLSSFDRSFGGHAPGDDGSLVIQQDIHLVHVIGDQLHVRYARLLETFQILFLSSDAAAGIGENEFLGFDAIKEGDRAAKTGD